MQDLNDLALYAAVVDHGGFGAASRALGVPKSRVSRRIAALEARLGVRLLQRTTRRFAVTEIGRAFHARCVAMLQEAQAAEDLVAATHDAPCGVVRLSCPTGLLRECVGAMLVEFAVANPRVQLQVLGQNRPVDVVGEGLDLALRVRPGPLQDSDLALRVFGLATLELVASPALMRRQFQAEAGSSPKEVAAGAARSTGSTDRPAVTGSGAAGPLLDPAQLASWPTLGHGAGGSGHSWLLRDSQAQQIELPHRPVYVSTELDNLRQAALAGLGAALLPKLLVGADLDNGALVRVLPGWTGQHEIVHAVYPSRRGLSPAVRVLIDHLSARFASLPGLVPAGPGDQRPPVTSSVAAVT